MKKTLALFAASATLVTGLGVAEASAAQAAAPYPGSVPTRTHASGPGRVNVNTSARVCGRVTMAGSTGTVHSGSITITVNRVGGGYISSQTLAYTGGQVCGQFGPLTTRGNYRAIVSYTPVSNAVYRPSRGTVFFKVHGRLA